MEEPKLGHLLTGDEKRDAIHIAIAPVIAAEHLLPGAHIGFVGDSKTHVTAMWVKTIGIVDPYLKQTVEAGDRFYMYLYPYTITGLRHQWTHPDFEGECVEDDVYVSPAKKLEAVNWLTKFCDDWCFGS